MNYNRLNYLSRRKQATSASVLKSFLLMSSFHLGKVTPILTMVLLICLSRWRFNSLFQMWVRTHARARTHTHTHTHTHDVQVFNFINYYYLKFTILLFNLLLLFYLLFIIILSIYNGQLLWLRVTNTLRLRVTHTHQLYWKLSVE